MNIEVSQFGWWQQAFFPALQEHQTQCLHYFWLVLSLASGSFLTHRLICWKLTAHLSQLSFSSLCAAHSSLVFSLRTSVNLGSLELQLHHLNSGSFFELWFGSPSLSWSLENLGNKMLQCRAHLIHFPFLQDPCFCCLILGDLKTLGSYNLVIFLAFCFYCFL